MKDGKMPPNWNPRRAGRAPKRLFRFTVGDIAAAAGKSVAAVQKARGRGVFDPRDLRSLAAYVMGGHSKRQDSPGDVAQNPLS